MGERQSITQKGVRAIDTRNLQLLNGSNAAKTSVRAPGLSADEDASFLLTVEVFLLTVRLFYLRWGNRK